MGIDRKRAPDHLVGAGRQCLERHAELRSVAAGKRGGSCLHGPALSIAHFNGAETRFQRLCEPEGDFVRWLRDRAADCRTCMIEMRMRKSRDRQKCQTAPTAAAIDRLIAMANSYFFGVSMTPGAGSLAGLPAAGISTQRCSPCSQCCTTGKYSICPGESSPAMKADMTNSS